MSAEPSDFVMPAGLGFDEEALSKPIPEPEPPARIGRPFPQSSPLTVRERLHQDAGFLDLDTDTLDPNRHYRWVRTDGQNASVMRHKLLGYRLESATAQGGARPLATPESNIDDSIRIGDVMLMSCPKADFERRLDTSFRRRETIIK